MSHGIISFFYSYNTASTHFFWTVVSVADVFPIVDNGAKKFLAQWKPTFVNGAANLPNKNPRTSPSWMILDNWFFLNFVFIDILSAKAFFISVFFFFFAVGNNLWCNSSSWTFAQLCICKFKSYFFVIFYLLQAWYTSLGKI